MRILNLYAGIGGNRKLWGDEHKVTAVEYNDEIAMIYKDFFPNDTVVIADAHQYLLDHFTEFDFVWSSPPCPTHSKFRYMASKMKPGTRGNGIVKYIDFKLYQEIVLLQNYSDALWVVENVVPYYEPLVKPTIELQRHLFWSNFKIVNQGIIEGADFDIKGNRNKNKYFDISRYKIKHRKDQIINNCVNPDLGLYILEQALGITRKENINQLELFS